VTIMTALSTDPTAIETPEAVPTPAAQVPTVATTPEPEPDSEPQNSLTRKFTEAEWTGVRELRTKLPDILAEAFPDKSDAKTAPISLWGVQIDPTAPVDPRISVVLVKFLRAKNLVLADAQAMLVSTLKWREEFEVAKLATEDFPEDIFGPVGHVFGKDKEQRPVTYNIYGGNKDLKVVFSDVKRFIRWRVSLMEKGVALIDFENVDSMVQVHDYEGVSMSSRDANSKAAATEASRIFQDYYPEFLSKKFFINVPTFMSWIFWIFKPLLAAKTVEKMSVVGTGVPTIHAALSPIIDEKELPKRYGGEAEAF